MLFIVFVSLSFVTFLCFWSWFLVTLINFVQFHKSQGGPLRVFLKWSLCLVVISIHKRLKLCFATVMTVSQWQCCLETAKSHFIIISEIKKTQILPDIEPYLSASVLFVFRHLAGPSPPPLPPPLWPSPFFFSQVGKLWRHFKNAQKLCQSIVWKCERKMMLVVLNWLVIAMMSFLNIEVIDYRKPLSS